MSPPSCSSQPKWRAFEVLGDDAGGIGTGPSAGAGGSWWEQMGTVYLVGFDHDRRVLREHTASSTQDTPGSIDIEWIPDGGSGFPGLSVRGLDDEDIYDTPAPAALAALCSTGNERLITACPPRPTAGHTAPRLDGVHSFAEVGSRRATGSAEARSTVR